MIADRSVPFGNVDGLLSLDFGVAEFGEVDRGERFGLYRQFVYEAVTVDHPNKPNARKILKNVLREAHKKTFNT